MKFRGTGILNFFWVLLIAELITIFAAWLLLNEGISIWINHKAKAIVSICKDASLTYDWSHLDEIPKHQANNPILLKYKKIFHILDQKYFPVNDGDITAVKIANGKEYLIAGEETTDNSQEYNGKADTLEIEAIRRGQTIYSEQPFTDDNGTQFRAYTPIFKNAQIIALLAVTLDTATIQNFKAIVRTSFWWSLIPATLISIFFAIILASRFVEPMEVLKEIEEVKIHPEQVIALTGVSDKNNCLSKREREIAALVGQGLKNREIAEKLSISEQTVKQHLKNIFEKLGISSRWKLVLLYASTKINSDLTV